MQILVVRINDNFFGLDISKIHEITTKVKITRVPNARPVIKGVTNLRGKIVPILDIKKRLGLRDTTSQSSCFVFFRLDGDFGLVVGIDVEEIVKTVSVLPEEIRRAPSELDSEFGEYILGLLPDDKLPIPIAILDLNKVFNLDSNTENHFESKNL